VHDSENYITTQVYFLTFEFWGY